MLIPGSGAVEALLLMAHPHRSPRSATGCFSSLGSGFLFSEEHPDTCILYEYELASTPEIRSSARRVPVQR